MRTKRYELHALRIARKAKRRRQTNRQNTTDTVYRYHIQTHETLQTDEWWDTSDRQKKTQPAPDRRDNRQQQLQSQPNTTQADTDEQNYQRKINTAHQNKVGQIAS